jgi:hypothetical protein
MEVFMSSSLLLFVSLLAGAEGEPARPIRVSSREVAQALLLNDARTDFYFSQKQIYLSGSIDRIIRAAVLSDGAAEANKEPAPGYAILILEQGRDHADERDVIIRCRFPESAREQLARLCPPGPIDHLIRGRFREHVARASVVLAGRQIMADILDVVDCELVPDIEAFQKTELSPFHPRRKAAANGENVDSSEISESVQQDRQVLDK